MPDAGWSITAPPERRAQLNAAFAAWRETTESLMAHSEDFDRGTLTPQAISAALLQSADALAVHAQNLADMLGAQGEHVQLDAMHRLFSQGEARLRQLAEASSKSMVDITSKIKYTVIDMIVNYQAIFTS